MDNQSTPLAEDNAQTIVESVDIQIPDHAIQRFARFLLPKLQADLEKQNQSEESKIG